MPYNAIVIDTANPNNIYVGTDIGIWKSADGGGSWNHMGPEVGMPNVAVFDLKIQGGTGRVFAFTHGRGAFMLDPNAINNPPVIAGFSPTNGPAGTSVTITGAKFNSASSVQFGGVNAAAFSVNSSTQIVATVAAGALTGPITIATPSGSASSANNFIVSSLPAIASFLPAAGNVGSVIVISGANLTGATAVSFGGVPAITFTVDSAVQISATVPAGAVTGKIGVTVGANTAQSGTVFTVTTLPVITGFSPTSGGVGATITISGANFLGATAVAFNGIPAGNKFILSSTQLTANVPAGASTGPISVTTVSGSGQSITSFVVIPAPSISGLSPSTGSAGTVVSITGNNFAGATAVTFNGLNAPSFDLPSSSQIIATAPPGVTTGPIAVITPGGTGVSASAFVALAAPGNDSFASAQIISGASGTISGNNTAATKEAGEPSHPAILAANPYAYPGAPPAAAPSVSIRSAVPLIRCWPSTRARP